MSKVDRNSIPNCPINNGHTVKVNTILGKEYYHCKECFEDISLLAKQPRQTPNPIGIVKPSVFSLYIIDNPNTTRATVHGVLTTMFGIDDLMATQILQRCQTTGESFITSRDTKAEAEQLFRRADNWLNVHEFRSSKNRKRNLIIEIREELG